MLKHGEHFLILWKEHFYLITLQLKSVKDQGIDFGLNKKNVLFLVQQITSGPTTFLLEMDLFSKFLVSG